MTSHDFPDPAPLWYKPQPPSPWCVYGPETIKDIQRTLSCPETGMMDPTTVNHIKGLQHIMGHDPTGVVTLETAIEIQRLRDRYHISEV